jgi:hypothetical protein
VGEKKFIQDYSQETSWKVVSWKTKTSNFTEMDCEDVNWTEPTSDDFDVGSVKLLGSTIKQFEAKIMSPG